MSLAKDSHADEVDLDQYFDFEQSSTHELHGDLSVSVPDTLNPALSFADASGVPCTLSHDSLSGALRYPFTSDVPDEFATVDALDNLDDFSKWLPTYNKPSQPCEYCKAHDLECYVTFDGQTACSPCNALFRECSFVKTSAHRSHKATFLDTLHTVNEDSAQCQGNLTSRTPLFSLGASMDEVVKDLLERKPEKHSSRFPRATLQVLKKWLDEHSDHPYPSEEEKEVLKERTGLSKNQICNWLANARRRGKVRPKRCTSPSISAASRARPIDIPGGYLPSDTRSPLQRWKDSPPDNEPARVMDIARAITTQSYGSQNPSDSSSAAQSVADPLKNSSGTGSYSGWRAQSTTSLDTGKSDGSKESASAWSHSSSRGSYNSFAKRDRRRRRRNNSAIPQTLNNNSKKRPFQCTFCTDTFVSKHDWSRHEQSVHVSTEKWICAPLGPIITVSLPANGGPPTTQCVYCQTPNPTPDHVERHNHEACEEKGLQARTFYRKDHLRQHLRLVHAVPLTPAMEAWKSTPTYLRSRCGFCKDGEVVFTTWGERADHLSKHFRSGATMAEWQGDWGFDPEVAAQVANAMPPYLIGTEQKTVIPFSGTVVQMTDAPQQTFAHLPRKSGGNNPSTCWEVLTVMLGQYVQHQRQLGIPITDEALQSQAREILYGDQDGWNQTAADNPEWLALFKQSHGLSGDRSAGSVTSVEAQWPATSHPGPGGMESNVFAASDIFGGFDFAPTTSALDLTTFGTSQANFESPDVLDLGEWKPLSAPTTSWYHKGPE